MSRRMAIATNGEYLDDGQRTAGTMTEEYDRLKKATDEMNAQRGSSDLDDDPIHPTHYQSYNTEIKIECIDAMRAAFGDEATATFCKLNAFKYVWRSSSKGLNTDIKKAIWYLNKFLELGGNSK